MQDTLIIIIILIILAVSHIIQMVLQHRKDARLYRKLNTLLELGYMQLDPEIQQGLDELQNPPKCKK